MTTDILARPPDFLPLFFYLLISPSSISLCIFPPHLGGGGDINRHYSVALFFFKFRHKEKIHKISSLHSIMLSPVLTRESKHIISTNTTVHLENTKERCAHRHKNVGAKLDLSLEFRTTEVSRFPAEGIILSRVSTIHSTESRAGHVVRPQVRLILNAHILPHRQPPRPVLGTSVNTNHKTK